MVAVTQSLALDERVEKLKTQYFPEGKENSFDEKGRSHLHSLLDDLGYEETEEFFARTRDNSIDIFVEKDLDQRDAGFTYLCLTSPTDVLKFQKGYSKYLEGKAGNLYSGVGIGIGLLVGVVLGISSLVPSIETYEEIKEAFFKSVDGYHTLVQGDFVAETSFLVAVSVPIVIGGIVEYVNYQDWKKDHEKNDREFRERYLVADKKYATGKNAVGLALSNS